MSDRRPCPACGAELSFLVQRVDKYAYWHCPACSLVTALPIPTAAELREFYDGFLFGSVADRDFDAKVAEVKRDVAFIASRLRTLPGLPAKPRLLDWGGGPGFYANAFAAEGFDVTLMDIDPQATHYAAERFPNRFRIITGDPGEYSGSERFDVIYCSHVVEHTPDLGRFTARLRDLLAPGGVAIVATPNQGSREFFFRVWWLRGYLAMAAHGLPSAALKFLRTPWICCDPPRHVHALNARSARRLFERSGFRVESCFTESSLDQSYASGRYRADWGVRTPLSLLRLPVELYTLAGLHLLRLADRGHRCGNNLVLIARVPERTSAQ